MSLVHRLLVAALLCITALPAQDGMLEVTMSGSGWNAREAETAALVGALDAFVEAQFKVTPNTQDRELRWTSMLLRAKPETLVKRKAFLAEPQEDTRGEWHVKLVATIDEKQLAARWEQGLAFIKLLQQPKVAVLLADRVEDLHGAEQKRDTAESHVAQAFKEELLAHAFQVVVPEQFEQRRAKIVAMKKLKAGDALVLQQIATEELASIYITGAGTAQGPYQSERAGRAKTSWKSDAKASAFWTDSAVLIATCSVPQSAGERVAISLQNVGKLLARDFVAGMFRQWHTRAYAGRAIAITITNGDEDEEDALVDVFVEFEREKRLAVTGKRLANGVLTVNVETMLEPRDLYRLIREAARKKDVTITREEVLDTSMRLTVEH